MVERNVFDTLWKKPLLNSEWELERPNICKILKAL